MRMGGRVTLEVVGVVVQLAVAVVAFALVMAALVRQ
jgi:hypothetical protein